MAQVIYDRRSHADQAWCGVVEKGCEPLFCAISGLPLSGLTKSIMTIILNETLVVITPPVGSCHCY